ncbi:MAG: hypothetical protein HYV20_05080 [Gemmatimonadetes bacterium]|nr:hypothetical protein [Gemmatimonadota bacterium]
MTIESDNPSLLLVSPNATTAGTSSIQLSLADGTTNFSYFVQGVESVTGTANVIIKAAGFKDGTAAMILVQPALQISGLATSRTATSANDEFIVQIGIPGTNSISLSQVQAVRAGGNTVTANLTNSEATVAQLVTLAGAGQTATASIQPTQFQTPTTVSTGGLAFDPLAVGTTTVSGSITGFISTVNASVTVSVTN